MNLKSFSFQRVSQFGATQNCYITIDGQVFAWAAKSFSVIFNNYESKEESDRGTPSRAPFEMTLKNSDFLTEAMKPVSEGDKELPFLIIFSNRIWEMAKETKFIPDYSTIENNKRICVMKSLDDLNAVEIEVPLQ